MKKQKIEHSTTFGRRDFLRGVGVGAGAAGVAAAVGVGGGEAEAAEKKDDAGYRETEHVRRFYQLARF